MKTYILTKENGQIQRSHKAIAIHRELSDGKYLVTITQYSASRSEDLSRFFHGPVINTFLKFMQERGYYKQESKAEARRIIKEVLKEVAGPEWEYWDPIQKMSIRKRKSFARDDKDPATISQDEAVEMLQELEVRFSEWGIPWPDNVRYNEMKAKHHAP